MGKVCKQSCFYTCMHLETTEIKIYMWRNLSGNREVSLKFAACHDGQKIFNILEIVPINNFHLKQKKQGSD